MGRGFEPRWGHVFGQTLTGVLLIVGIGVVVLAFAAWADWRSAKRASETLQQAPEATSPETDVPLPTPEYVSAADAQRRSQEPQSLDDEQSAQITADGGIEIEAQLVDPRLKTHADPEALIVFGARVLCCPEGIGSLREAMQTLERSSADKTPIVLVAPMIDPEVADVLVVNTARGTLSGGAVTAGAGDCIELAERLGGHAVTRADLQSGYVPHSSYGLAASVVATDSSATFWPTEVSSSDADPQA